LRMEDGGVKAESRKAEIWAILKSGVRRFVWFVCPVVKRKRTKQTHPRPPKGQPKDGKGPIKD